MLDRRTSRLSDTPLYSPACISLPPSLPSAAVLLGETATQSLLLLSSALVALLLVAGVLHLLLQRQRSQLAALLTRIESYDQERIETGERHSGSTELPVADADSEDVPAGQSTLAGNDPLVGMTSFIMRLVSSDADAGDTISVSERALVAVHSHLHEQLTPRHLAEELHLSLRSLERSLLSELDCSPRQLILAMKMREARRLLLSGSYRVNEVATRLAFSNPHYFSSRFKTFYGESPSAVARRAQER